ncbi:hypothetical protein C900_05669 [Fulvivirga imtechensis AK7]|uniref:Uncharacterized protein n=1 Tax=Fulvivirga imtechensis AK7 TaxID=1237149 RepID=L8JMZ5_9BACT|nr:hypothetical protein [Fulvivirga imtechensis]ELR68889.1 hypothetical protein C900_05669 [Fulvivirga imtechensis AK7]
MKIITLTLLLLISYKGFCCSCQRPEKISNKDFNSYDLIVKGRIDKIDKGDRVNVIYVRIERRYKGVITGEAVTVSTPSQSGMCGISPQVGDTWLIFANSYKDSYITDICTRTKSLNPQAWNYRKQEVKDDLRFLERKLKNKR